MNQWDSFALNFRGAKGEIGGWREMGLDKGGWLWRWCWDRHAAVGRRERKVVVGRLLFLYGSTTSDCVEFLWKAGWCKGCEQRVG